MKTKKNFLQLLVLSVFLVFGTSCTVYQPKYQKKGMIISTKPQGKVPPGQMKKMTGDKSAKTYAPGQQKKHKK